MEQTEEGRKRLERAKTRETAYYLAHHEQEQREAASASKRPAEEGEQKEAKKRVVEVEVDIPLPDLAAPASTSPDPLPVEEWESVMEGKAVDHPWSSLLRMRGGDGHAQSVGYELGLLEAMDLMRDED